MATPRPSEHHALRCSPFHASTGSDPVGTAGCYDAFLVVELPRPWDHDVSTMWPFADLGVAGPSIEGADGRTWRPMAVVPSGEPDGRVGVDVWERTTRIDGGRTLSGPYRHHSWRVAPGDLVPLGGALLDGGPLDDGPLSLGSVPSAVSTAPSASDPGALLVCTHGGRDVCCGSSGTTLAAALTASALTASAPSASEPPASERSVPERSASEPLVSVPVRCCSHTGGHRFAPTAITFPDGYGWAHLDAGTARGVAERTAPIESVIGHCRGSSLFGAGPAQVADRALLGAVGWSWADATRQVTVPDGPVPAAPGDAAVEVAVTGRLPDGSEVDAVVAVDVERRVPTPPCGEPADDGSSTAPVWRVVDLRRS